ncbi:MAG: carbohydrate ABC transporter permease [Rhizobiales bacterium]|nr:carbohydrate ABC transporter permease [Hyphomicrobiales bacterium]
MNTKATNAPSQGVPAVGSGISVGRIVKYAAIALALFWSLAPVYWMLATSFKTELEATRINPTLIPVEPTLANYIGLGGQSLPFFAFFFNSVISCLATAIIAVIIATPAAYSLSRARFRLRGPISYSVLLFRMLPLVVMLALSG